jgi:hypothetical protein
MRCEGSAALPQLRVLGFGLLVDGMSGSASFQRVRKSWYDLRGQYNPAGPKYGSDVAQDASAALRLTRRTANP